MSSIRALAAVAFLAASTSISSAATLTFDFESVAFGALPGSTLTLNQGGVDVTFSGLGLLIRSLGGAFDTTYGISHYLSTSPFDLQAITIDIGPGFNVTSATILNPINGTVSPEEDTISGSAFAGGALVDSIVSTAALITLSGAGLTQLLFDDVGDTGYVIGQLVLEGDFVSQVPLPAALPLLAGGLAGLGALGARRRRKAA